MASEYTIDAAGKTLGRVASEAAKALMGKTYSGYPGGQQLESYKMLSSRRGAGEPLRRAVKRMLPRNTFLTDRLKNLLISE